MTLILISRNFIKCYLTWVSKSIKNYSVYIRIVFIINIITGQVIYPGKVTDADTFRIGNIGHIFPQDARKLIECIKKVLQEMKVSIPIKY